MSITSMLNSISKYSIFWLGLLVGLLFFTLKAVGYDLSSFPGDLGDARFNIYLLEHAHQYFVLGSVATEGYWNAPFMYPAPAVITISDNLLGTFPFFSIFRLLGCDVYKSFQLWYITLTILNYTVTFLFLKWLFKNKYAAVLGAFVFAFSIALQSQIVHAQTYPRFAIPLAYWFALLFIKHLNSRYFLMTLLMVVYEIYCGIYLGFLLFVPIAILLVYSLVINYKRVIKSYLKVGWILSMLTSVILALAALLPIILPYRERSESVIKMTFNDISYSIPVLKSYLFAHFGSVFWSDLGQVGTDLKFWWDHQLFPGGLVIVALFFVCSYVFQKVSIKTLIKDKRWLALGITALLTFLLFLKYDGASLYIYVMKLPGYNSMRALQRVINVELMHFGIAVSIMFIILKSRIKKKNQSFLFAFFFIFLVCDNLVRKEDYVKTRITTAQTRVDRLVAQIHAKEAQIISYEPDTIETLDLHYQLDAMLAAQFLGIRSINGYSATSPEGFDPYWHYPNEENRRNWCKQNGINVEDITIINSNWQ